MLFIILIIMMIVAGLCHLFRRHILRIKEPTLDELWLELEQQEWFQDLSHHPDYAASIRNLREQGLLRDTHYVQKLIHHQGTIDGFIRYIKK